MPGQRLCGQKKNDHRPAELQKTLATSEALLTVKKGTALLEARDWPEKDRGLAAGLKIRCDDETEKDEDAVMSSDTPASSASKK
ncbi:hypothetical protein BDDG_07324 [Blastomyces dermatitidis ATCC 18188]|uniref:Uncharacterized protein n=1 Tax=Ajellomyces dermatitidis (strain ATCC 18188 / CBS 674.68) TaxID=653446 RepID=F2TMB6_AJEDA|nr:hypothetical protein BDDG_07324 [Blastomyces dermatitidis ATCC 18188]